MGKAIGMVEYKTVSAGVAAADAMVKTAQVDIIEAQTVCPGKYITVISGELSAVKAAVEAAIEKAKKEAGEDGMYLDSTVIAHPDEKICRAIL